jgi:hypothetical protein
MGNIRKKGITIQAKVNFKNEKYSRFLKIY